MSLIIGTNIASLAVMRHIRSSERDLSHAIQALASGTRIVNSGDDAAGFAISETLRGQVSGLRGAKQNTENAVSFVQVAEGGLNEQNNILIRLRELAVQSASDTVSNREREFLNQEFTQLIKEFDRIAKTTEFGSKKLLAGNVQEFKFQIGANSGPENVVEYRLDADTTSSEMDIDDLSINYQKYARDTLKTLDEAVYKISEVRANFGAIQSRFMYARDNLDVQIENIENARSTIADADVAVESANLMRATIKRNMGIAILAQANLPPENIMRLLY